MNRLKFTLLVGFTLLLIGSCKKGGVFCYKPDGNIVIETRAHTDFSKISLCMSADLYITQGEAYAVSIEASNNLLGIIETKVSGSTLKIDVKKGKCIRGNYSVKVYITMPNLKSLSISGSGDVYIPNKLSTSELSVDISGSGNMEIDSLSVDELETRISGSGDLYVSAIDTIENESFNISGSGEIRTFNVPAKNVVIRVSGSGECEVNAIESLAVDISGSGDVTYKGNPIIEQRISGSGSVKPY